MRFYQNGCWILSDVLYVSVEMILYICIFLDMANYTDFRMLNQSCIPGIMMYLWQGLVC